MTEIQTQTATVHVLKIEGKELSLSKYRQLDTYEMYDGLQFFHAFGRVNTQAQNQGGWGGLDLLGRNSHTGALTKLLLTRADIMDMERHSVHKQLLANYWELPLIILGGMK
jgi:hypothetical protein